METLSLGGLPLDGAAPAAVAAPRGQRGDLRQLPRRLPGSLHGRARRRSDSSRGRRARRSTGPRRPGSATGSWAETSSASGPRRNGRALLTLPHPRGESPSLHPPPEEPSSQLMFDWRELRRWGSTRNACPRAASSSSARRRCGRSTGRTHPGRDRPPPRPDRPHRGPARRAAAAHPRPGAACASGTALSDGRRLHVRLGVLAAARRDVRLRVSLLPATHRLRGGGVPQAPVAAQRDGREEDRPRWARTATWLWRGRERPASSFASGPRTGRYAGSTTSACR